MTYRLLWAAALLGVVVHLTGIGWDAYLHAQDSTLAGREGIFTLSNPSHVLIIVGFGITAWSVMAVGVVWLNRRNFGGDNRAAFILRTSSLPVAGLAAAGAIWLTALAEDQSAAAHAHLHAASAAGDVAHTHDAGSGLDTIERAVFSRTGAAPDGHSHDPASAAQSTASGEGAPHSHGTEVKATSDQLVAAANFVAKVKTASARYEDVRAAMAAGYIQITQDLPNIAAHFINLKYNADGVLMDPERPEVLLYTKRLDGAWRLVGFMFTSETVSETPPSFFGALDVWHRHENLCFTPNAVSVKTSAAECIGGIFQKTTVWNLHVWTAPGASGVFAHDFDPISPGTFPPATRPAAQDALVRTP